MRVSILDWTYTNIRGVNNLSVSLEKNQDVPHKISLIMMPNGTGKTTTQSLLRAVFDGKAKDWSYEKVLDFKPPNSDKLTGEFRATVLINDKVHVVIIKLDYSSGIARYLTSKVGDQGGQERGHNIPSVLKSTFTTEFVKRFVFDGELAKDIIGKESQEAERTIRFLYQLNRLSEMKSRVDQIIEQKQKDAERKTTARTEQGLQKFRTTVAYLKTSLAQLLSRKNELEEKLKVETDKLNGVNLKMEDHIKSDESLRTVVDDLQKQRIFIESKVNENTQEVLNYMRNPYLLSESLADKLGGLAEKMTALQLPRTMSKQFFEELADHDKCVCGRGIGPNEKQQILINSEDYLAEDQIGVINSIKSSIRERSYDGELEREVSVLGADLQKRNEIKKEWDRIQAKQKENGDEILQELEKEKAELENSIEACKIELKQLTTKDSFERKGLDSQSNIPTCEQELENTNEKLLQVTQTIEFARKANKIKRLLTQVEITTMDKLKERIKNETNQKISKIINDENLFVEKIDGYLKLQGKSGASEGQSLAIAYSFLGSMFETSAYSLPFIVDTPAGPLDLHVRNEVSAILPNLFDQLLIFITSGEREGFTENFRERDDVQFLTIHRDIDETKCIEGKDYFESFQSLETKVEEGV